ncbi:hypothetical protein MHU86_22837 [Fragilaria crotonensis]|nr:hypothetical protein MHU86_22837 [Fragilaria crotonensis]
MSSIPRVITNKTIMTGLPAQFKSFVPFESVVVGASRALKIPVVAPKIKKSKVSEISLSVPSAVPSGLNKPFNVVSKHVVGVR